MKKLRSFYESKYFNVFLFIIYFMIPFVVYGHYFLNNIVPVSGDGVQFFSMKFFANNALKDGEIPLWNPYLSNGIPFAGDLNGVFYPIAILLSFLPIKEFVYCYYALHLALGAFFIYLYLKEINCDKFVSICTSLIYFFSIHLGGYRKSHMGIIASVVFLPIILYFIEKYINTLKMKYLLFSSISMSVVLLNGMIQHDIYIDIVVFIYLICRMISVKIPFKKIFINLIIWGVVYIGISCIQLIPSLELLQYYKEAGAGETSYQTFLSYSIIPIKIIMMLFPNMFGSDVYAALGTSYSSGLDIEIFLGVGVFVFILFAFIKYFKDSRVKLAAFFMFGSFVFAANAHIPILNKIIYHIPVLGGFRCSSRSLFIFIFFGFVVFAISLSKLKEENNLQTFIGFVTKFCIFISSVLIIVFPLIYIVSTDLTLEILKTRYESLKLVFMMPLIAMFTIAICFRILYYFHLKHKISMRKMYVFLSIFMLMLTIYETSRFTLISAPTSIDDFKATTVLAENIKADLKNNKIWVANPYIDPSLRSLIEFNSNVSKEIPAINAYIAFNNPRLFRLFTNQNIMKPYYNSSGLLAGFIDAKNNILMQNDLLSMLGIKYILDPQSLITEDGTAITSMKELETTYKKDAISIPDQQGELYVFSDIINIEPNTYYKISFTASTNQKQTSFYADFAGGAEYDKAEQDVIFGIDAGEKLYEAILNSDNSNDTEKVYFRFVANPTAEINITNLKVAKMAITTEKNVYLPYYIDESNRIFENTKVKDILYTPSSVIGINNVDDIYNNVHSYDLDDVSYIENIDSFTTADTIIKNINWKRNSISADVTADEDTFINFSQNYYPGWKAYVDGKKTDIYMVNGLIQGIKVSGGEHTIIFKFIPTSLIIGSIISVITIIFVIFLLNKEKVKKV